MRSAHVRAFGPRSRLFRVQEKVLAHALSFPRAERVVYSTCSVHHTENEGVVSRVLARFPGESLGLARGRAMEGGKSERGDARSLQTVVDFPSAPWPQALKWRERCRTGLRAAMGRSTTSLPQGVSGRLERSSLRGFSSLSWCGGVPFLNKRETY